MINLNSLFNCNGNTSDGFVKLTSDTFRLSNTTYNINLNSTVFVDTTNGEFGILFPQNPEPGNTIVIIDTGGNLDKEPVRIQGFGNLFGIGIVVGVTIPSQNQIYNLSIPYTKYTFVYANTDVGWVISTDRLGIVDTNQHTIIKNNLQILGNSFIFKNGMIESSVSETSSTVDTIVNSLPIDKFRSVKYTVQITSGENYNYSEIIVLHNGTDVNFNEYGNTYFGVKNLGTFTSDILNNNLRLIFTPSTSDIMKVKVIATAMSI